MSADFFTNLKITQPFKNLQVGSGSHAQQTSKMITGIEDALLEVAPSHVIVYGDTNSTLAGALAASKLNIPLSHVEAGLRSFNRNMPEEINRILVDHASTLLFAPTLSALKQLKKENLGGRSFFSGDLSVELIDQVIKNISHTGNKPYLFATIHRAENCADEERIKKIILKLRSSSIPIHLHCHPRLIKVLQSLGIANSVQSLHILEPLNYFDSLSSIFNAVGVITDSGGVQKEAYLIGKPCLIVRSETEWIETIETGTSFLDPDLEMIDNFWSLNAGKVADSSVFGDGNTSKFVIDKILTQSY